VGEKGHKSAAESTVQTAQQRSSWAYGSATGVGELDSISLRVHWQGKFKVSARVNLSLSVSVVPVASLACLPAVAAGRLVYLSIWCGQGRNERKQATTPLRRLAGPELERCHKAEKDQHLFLFFPPPPTQPPHLSTQSFYSTIIHLSLAN
jgi:hypothetical protein